MEMIKGNNGLMEEIQEPVWWVSSNSHFHILNNITHISTHFFTHTYFKKLQTTILKLLYQTPPVKSGKSAHMVQIVKSSRKNNIKYQKIKDLCSSFDVGILGNFHGLL